MRHLLFSLLALALLATSGACAAQTVIHHCVGADGTPIFTDRTCASLGALSTKHAGNPLVPSHAHGPRHCPLDLNDLRKRVAAAFHRRNANALAGLMLWRGYAEGEATDIIRQLAQLMRSPFLGFADIGDTGDTGEMGQTGQPGQKAPAAFTWPPPLVPANASSSAMPSPARTLAIQFRNPARPVVTFNVTRRDGCVWLEPPPLARETYP